MDCYDALTNFRFRSVPNTLVIDNYTQQVDNYGNNQVVRLTEHATQINGKYVVNNHLGIADSELYPLMSPFILYPQCWYLKCGD